MSTFVVIGMSSHVSVRDDSVAQHQSYTHSSHLQIETFCCHYSQMALCVPISSHSSMFHSILQRLPSGLPTHATLGATGSLANLTCIWPICCNMEEEGPKSKQNAYQTKLSGAALLALSLLSLSTRCPI